MRVILDIPDETFIKLSKHFEQYKEQEYNKVGGRDRFMIYWRADLTFEGMLLGKLSEVN